MTSLHEQTHPLPAMTRMTDDQSLLPTPKRRKLPSDDEPASRYANSTKWRFQLSVVFTASINDQAQLPAYVQRA